MTLETPARSESSGIEVSVGTLAWFGLGALFVAIRLAGVLSVPVGGSELDALSGAWAAHAGNDDSRFVPTLFQALSAWSFEFSSSETPMRILVLLAGCSVPLALYRLRSMLGEAGALAALALLAVDPVTVLLGSTAWVGGFDLAIALWILVLSREPDLPKWLVGTAAFVVATAGPVVLPVVAAIAAVRLATQRYPSRETALWLGGGIVLALLVSSSAFGFGLKDPVFPPLLSFANGFEAEATSESAGRLLVLYAAPIALLGITAGAWRAYLCWSEEEWHDDVIVLFVAGGLSLVWAVLAVGSHDATPLAALAIPAALLAGKEAPAALASLRDVDWPIAIAPLAALVIGLLVAEAYVVDWARVARVGKDRDQLIVAGLVVASIACVGILLSNRRTAPSLFVPVGAFFIFAMASGATNIAFGGPNEPLPSPVSTIQGREIRDIALQARGELGGPIVLHADFEDAATWPFRDSGPIVFASRVPADAGLVVWPANAPAPDGFSVLEGQWSLLEDRRGPDEGFLAYLRWLTNRNVLKNSPLPVAVYLRTEQ